MMRLFLRLVLSALPTLSMAQDWQFNSFDDGSFFSASISPRQISGLALVCGERSPQGLSAAQTGNMEPDITARDSFRIYLGEESIGRVGGASGYRNDVLVVIGTTGYRLPPIIWNELYGTWETDLPAADPVYTAIAAQPSFELRSASGSRIVPASGFAQALKQLTSYCQGMFANIGLPWHTVAPVPVPQVTMRQVAEAAVFTGCGGPANKGPNTFLTGDIDGDSLQDVVVDWGAITCSGGYPRPFCGASMCSAQVFISSLYQRRQAPEDLLASGVWLQPLTNGNMGIGTGGSLSMCTGSVNASCEFIWYWNGSELVRLN